MAGMFGPLRADEIECRVSQIVETKKGVGVILLLYKDARTDANLLDEVMGQDGWQCKFYECKGNLFCSVGLKIGDEWLWKDDCGAESNTERQKGEASDAFKRACFKWGLGRELYTSPLIWIDSEDCEKLYQDNSGKWKCYDKFKVRLIEYNNGSISKLVIDNSHGIVVYSYDEINYGKTR